MIQLYFQFCTVGIFLQNFTEEDTVIKITYFKCNVRNAVSKVRF